MDDEIQNHRRNGKKSSTCIYLNTLQQHSKFKPFSSTLGVAATLLTTFSYTRKEMLVKVSKCY